MNQTFLTELAEKSPYVIYQDRLYQVAHGLESHNSIVIGGCRFGLSPGPTVDELEQLFCDRHKDEIFEFKRKFVHDKLQQEIRSQREVDGLVGREKLLHYALTELFPLLVGDGSELEELLTQETSGSDYLGNLTSRLNQPTVQRSTIDRVKRQLIDGVRSEAVYPNMRGGVQDSLLRVLLGRRRTDTTRTSTVQEGIKGTNILVYNGDVYEFTSGEGGQHEGSFGKSKFQLAPIQRLDTLDNKYLNYLNKEFSKQALDEFEDQIKEISRIRARTQSIKHLLGRQEYQIKDVGYKWSGRDLYVYKQVPAFAMKAPGENVYYEFGSCKIAIKLGYDQGGNVITGGASWVLGNYSHPFLPDSSSGQRICMGGYAASNLKTPAGIATHLGAAVNVILNGYTRTCHPHRQLSDFNLRRISKHNAERKGLLITNRR
jgi:hypothetical protein